ncbi:acyl-ACP--UDP-N-acetylglucosamine O-acyltransferase [Sulfuritalea sp.]|uniref:acyl-ACP--UDP-N-acetylglucosamine O-acyltransferase n=1 Tax=Sulfuritalea sp. TaxID=2480090 RepID=UPI001AD553B7|nr:acyl-ACP--UDP-N-acetylglucosamine O-acyltransferase [Sulfuritalea sp.]MBN8474690.1 acyl-ACP--UDP-N-acetylglucosamine O-acyltransferase [Sulfuritalea sp.]
MMGIHPTAIVHPSAKLGRGVVVGPYSVVGEHVEIGDHSVIGPHVVVTGHTMIGSDNRIFQFCSIGEQPQDKKYAGEPTRLEIGDRNTIREFCTFNCGTAQDSGVTRLGNDNWIMAYVHLAHDCQVGDNTIFANNAQLAGHVRVGDWAILGGFTVVHQFVRIGAHSITAMGTILLQDLPPFVMAAGNPAEPRSINAEGLKRRGFSPTAIAAIKRAYKTLYKAGMKLDEARAALEAESLTVPELSVLAGFLVASGRGIVR